MTKLFMAVIFFLIITPVAFLARLLGIQCLDRDIDLSTESYWVKRNDVKKDKADYESQR